MFLGLGNVFLEVQNSIAFWNTPGRPRRVRQLEAEPVAADFHVFLVETQTRQGTRHFESTRSMVPSESSGKLSRADNSAARLSLAHCVPFCELVKRARNQHRVPKLVGAVFAHVEFDRESFQLRIG